MYAIGFKCIEEHVLSEMLKQHDGSYESFLVSLETDLQAHADGTGYLILDLLWELFLNKSELTFLKG